MFFTVKFSNTAAVTFTSLHHGCLYRDVDSTTTSSNTPGKHLGNLVGMSCVSGTGRCHLQTDYTLYSNLLNVFKRVSVTIQNHNVEAFMQIFTYSK